MTACWSTAYSTFNTNVKLKMPDLLFNLSELENENNEFLQDRVLDQIGQNIDDMARMKN